jgi:hypothetical protein
MIPMAGDIDETRARLLSLGLRPDQVELHLRRLALIAAKRCKPPPRPPKPAPIRTLDQAQLHQVLSKLAHGSWVRYRRSTDQRPIWAGDAVIAVLGLTDKTSGRRTASALLSWLETKRFIAKGTRLPLPGRRQHLVQVLQVPPSPSPPPTLARTRLGSSSMVRTRLQPSHGEATALA